jgi:formylglycine-generating enzyme required for sulfatase activity
MLLEEVQCVERVTIDCGGGVKLELARIPAGTFLMGSPAEGKEAMVVKVMNEKLGLYDETQHQVTISKPFYLGIHPVTQAVYEAVMGTNPGHFAGDDLSIENVSWDDAVDFCRNLSRQTGHAFRLPTEAEWEYACRAGTTTPFYTGEKNSTDLANYDGRHFFYNGVEGVYREKMMPVGSFPANPWGLHDMHGNVWEWCSDRFGKYPKESVTDPEGPVKGLNRVLRGGSWILPPYFCRSASRYRLGHGERNMDIGSLLSKTILPEGTCLQKSL